MNAPTTGDPRPPGPRDWRCDYSYNGNAVHIRPRNDHIWHTPDDECPCGPTSQYLDIDAPCGWLITHHALDGRDITRDYYAPTPNPTGGHDHPDDNGKACV